MQAGYDDLETIGLALKAQQAANLPSIGFLGPLSQSAMDHGLCATATRPRMGRLTLDAIDRFRAQIDAFIDDLVAEQRKQMPNQPAEALQAMLMRGQCLCTAAERLLKEPQQ